MIRHRTVRLHSAVLAAKVPASTGAMMSRLRAPLFAVIGLFCFDIAAALAHPHVWVTMRSEIVYGPDGVATGVRHSWTFDDMFSAFATQGMDTDKDGKLSRDELSGLAEVNVTSLKDYDFFTFAAADGRKAAFKAPVDYWLEHADNALTLHFTLPFDKPVKAARLDLEVYDPTYFVSFSLAEKEPAALVQAPSQCKLEVAKPASPDTTQSQRLSEAFFDQLEQGSTFGAQFANKITVTCP